MHSGASVWARGLLADKATVPKIASSMFMRALSHRIADGRFV